MASAPSTPMPLTLDRPEYGAGRGKGGGGRPAGKGDGHTGRGKGGGRPAAGGGKAAADDRRPCHYHHVDLIPSLSRSLASQRSPSRRSPFGRLLSFCRPTPLLELLRRFERRVSRYEDAYDEVCHEFHQKMKEWHDAIDAREEHMQAAHKAWYMAQMNNTPMPPYVDPPPKPLMPVLSSKAEFLAHLATGTPGLSHSQTHFGRSTASSLESSRTTPLHQGGPSPGHSDRDSRPHSPTQLVPSMNFDFDL